MRVLGEAIADEICASLIHQMVDISPERRTPALAASDSEDRVSIATHAHALHDSHLLRSMRGPASSQGIQFDTIKMGVIDVHHALLKAGRSGRDCRVAGTQAALMSPPLEGAQIVICGGATCESGKRWKSRIEKSPEWRNKAVMRWTRR